MSFLITDFDPIDFACLGDCDVMLEAMIILNDKWSLTGDLSVDKIAFSTRYYDESLTLPQIVVAPGGGTESPPMTVGASEAIYKNMPTLEFNIYVRPQSDSNTSLGWAKNAIYRIRKETERILRSGSSLNNENEEKFLFLVDWRRDDDLLTRSPLLRLFGKAYIVSFVKGV